MQKIFFFVVLFTSDSKITRRILKLGFIVPGLFSVNNRACSLFRWPLEAFWVFSSFSVCYGEGGGCHRLSSFFLCLFIRSVILRVTRISCFRAFKISVKNSIIKLNRRAGRVGWVEGGGTLVNLLSHDEDERLYSGLFTLRANWITRPRSVIRYAPSRTSRTLSHDSLSYTGIIILFLSLYYSFLFYISTFEF